MKKIVVGSDHVGHPLKEAVKKLLAERGIEVEDVGAYNPDVSVDYPDFATRVAQVVARGECASGIVICGTGIGVSIAANKVPGVRAALCFDTYTAHQARAHNDANVLAMGTWVVTPQRAASILQEWLTTPFEFGRHVARVHKLDNARMCSGSEPTRYSLSQISDSRFHYGIAISLKETAFAPVLFAGRLEEGLRAAAENSFELVELSVRNPREIEAEQLTTLAKRYGLRISALASGQSCLHEGLCLSAAQPDVRAQAIQRICEIINLASELETALIIGGARGRFSRTPPPGDEYAWTVEAVGECARYARLRGVPTLLEPINRYETNFVNTLAEGLHLLDDIGEPTFKLLADAFHMNIEEGDISASLRQVGERIGYVHIADSNRRAPGQGHTDFRAIFQSLTQIGYSGPVSAEMLPLPDDLTALHQLHSFLMALDGMHTVST